MEEQVKDHVNDKDANDMKNRKFDLRQLKDISMIR